MTEKLNGELGVVLERIDALRIDIADVKDDIKSVKKEVSDGCKSAGDFQVLYTREHTKLESFTLELIKDSADHGVRLTTLESLIKPLVFSNKIVTLIGSAFALSAVGFLWAIFTHQVTIVIP